MRIVIDLQGAQGASRFRGLGRFSLWFAKSILENNKNHHDIHILLNGHFQEAIDAIRLELKNLISTDNILIFYPLSNTAYILGSHDKRSISENMYKAFIDSLIPDALIIASFFEGYTDACIFAVDDNRSYKTFSVLYDLIPYLFPEIYFSNEDYKNFYLAHLEKFKKIDYFFSISECSKNDVYKFLDFNLNNIINIKGAIPSDLNIDVQKDASFFESYGITKPFLLSTMANDPRKNFEGLLHAFLSSDVSKNYQLVLITKLEPHQENILKDVLKKYHREHEAVVITGYVEDAELITLYKNCLASIFPSTYEGFGLPILEAMMCGKAVICSNVSSTPEIIECDEALFDPYDIASMRLKIEQVLTDDVFRKKLEQHGLSQSKKFTWKDVAEKTLKFVENKVIQNDHTILLTNKKKLAFVSPLPPEKTGIADYSAELLPALKIYYDIDVIVEQPLVKDDWIEKNCVIYNPDYLKKNYKKYDRVLYHMGNSPLHIYVMDLMKVVPGVVVLHDLYISGIFKYEELVLGIKNSLKHNIYKSHGFKELLSVKNITDVDELMSLFPSSEMIFNNALGVIFHSFFAQHLAKKYYGINSFKKSIPLLRKTIVTKKNKESLKKELGFDPDSFIISSFGFVDESKLHHVIYQAFLQSICFADKNVVIVFVGGDGSLYAQQLKKNIYDQKLSDRILYTGWASQDVYQDYLIITDIAIQLRGVSRGESSAAVLDCLNYGIPTIINANGSMAEISDNVVIKLEDQFKLENLIQAFNDLYLSREKREILSSLGKKYIQEERSPEKCAKQYMEQIEYYYLNNRHSIHFIDQTFSDYPLIYEKYLHEITMKINKMLPNKTGIRRIFVDISVLVVQDLKTGIERVTRALLLELINNPPKGYRVEPVYATSSFSYRYARKYICEIFGIEDLSLKDELIDCNQGDIFFLLDWAVNTTCLYENFLYSLKNQGVKIISFIHDLLPIRLPQFFPSNMDYFYDWINVLLKNSNQIICNSKSTADDVRLWINENNIEHAKSIDIDYINLGSDIENSMPTKGVPNNAQVMFEQMNERISFLMVGTIEPRKGHKQTLEAFEELWKSGVDVNLIIVGKQGWQMEDFVEKLNHHPEFNKRLFWLNGISDEYLEKIYKHSTALIAASEGEGYGLPLIEAAKHKIPIIARDIPVFQEVAQGKAYFFDNTKEALAIYRSIVTWIKLYEKKQHPQSDDIKAITWKESAQQLVEKMIRKASNK